MTGQEMRLDPARLLTIDVEAEVAKLARAQLDGAWQLGVELARRALLAGARHLAFATSARRLALRDDGTPIAPATLEHLALALDPSEDAERRHAALVAAEAQGLGLLVGLDGLRARRLVLVSGGRRLRWEGHALAAIDEGPHQPGTHVMIDLPLDRARARAALDRACRFARAEVVVDGEVVPAGFVDPLAEAPLPSPLAGRLCIPRAGTEARLWILVGGVVATRMSVPTLPPCEIALEVSDAAQRSSPVAAREAATPLVPQLGPPLLELALGLGREIGRHGEPDQRRIRRVLLDAARLRLGRTEILRLPILPAVQNGRPIWRSLSDLGSPGRPLPSIPPHDDPRRYLLPSLALILDSEERALLAELLDLRFLTPALRGCRPRSTERVREGLHRLRSAVARAIVWEGEALAESRLSGEERALVAQLRLHLSAAVDDVLLCSGRRSPSVLLRDGRRQLRIGRHHALLVAGRRLLGREPAWLYPILAALLREREWAAAEARAHWLAHVAPRRPESEA